MLRRMQGGQHRGRGAASGGALPPGHPPTSRNAQARCQGMSLPGGPGATQAWKSHVTAVCNAPPTQYPVPASGVPRYKSPPNQESQRHAPTRFVWSIQSPPSRCPPVQVRSKTRGHFPCKHCWPAPSGTPPSSDTGKNVPAKTFH